MGVEISVRYFLYRFKLFATKLLLQTPAGGPNKMFLSFFFWNFELLSG